MNDKRTITFLDFAFVGIAIMMFSKTADVMVYYTPQLVIQMFGDIREYYGMLTALWIEGIMGALHFHPRADGGKPQTVKWILFAISAACQQFDGMITNNTLMNQTPFIKSIFENWVPAIPAMILLLLLWVGKLPEVDAPSQPSLLARMRKIGLSHAFDGLKDYWYGENKPKVTMPMTTYPANTNVPKPDEPETANPTQRRNGANH